MAVSFSNHKRTETNMRSTFDPLLYHTIYTFATTHLLFYQTVRVICPVMAGGGRAADAVYRSVGRARRRSRQGGGGGGTTAMVWSANLPWLRAFNVACWGAPWQGSFPGTNHTDFYILYLDLWVLRLGNGSIVSVSRFCVICRYKWAEIFDGDPFRDKKDPDPGTQARGPGDPDPGPGPRDPDLGTRARGPGPRDPDPGAWTPGPGPPSSFHMLVYSHSHPCNRS